MCDCWLSCIEGILKAFSKNAYIIIAIEGSPFCVAGKKAVKLIANNFISTVAIQSIGDFVLVVARLFIVAISVFVAAELIVVTISGRSSHI